MASAAVLDGIKASAVAQPACTISWDGGGDDDLWSNAANWDRELDPNPLPGSNDHACIGSEFTADHASGDDSVLSVQVAGALTLSGGSLSLTDTANASNAANFTLSGGTLAGEGTLTVSGSFVWSGGVQAGDGGRTVIAGGAAGTIDAPGSQVSLGGGRTLQNDGTLRWTAGQIVLDDAASATTIENAGVFDVQGDGNIFRQCCAPVAPLVHNAVGAVFRKSAGDGTTAVGVAFDNDGTVAAGAGTLDVTGPFANYSSLSKTLTGGTYLVSARLRFNDADIVTNAATVVLDGAASEIVDQADDDGLRNFATNASGGDFTIRNGRDLTTPGAFTSSGTLTVGANSTFTAMGAAVNVTGGILAGIGTVGPVVNAAGGTVSPGLSPGTLGVAGPYAQGSGGSLRVEVAGLTAGTGHDRLEVSGNATLDGTLEIVTDPAFTPSEGDSIVILSASSVTGQFANVVGTELGGGLHWVVVYTATNVQLTVAGRSLSIGNASADEGDDLTFQVVLSEADPVNTITVEFATGGGTATDPDDYTGQSGTLTFNPGETIQTVTVPTVQDALHEDDETVLVTLSNPTGAPISDGEGQGTIVDDDPVPTLSIDDVSVTEGDSDPTEATFTVSLSAASGKQVTVDYATADGSATAPDDYTAIATTALTFAPGETEQTITVLVQGDTLVEEDETFFVNLSNPGNATIADDQGQGTIVDNEPDQADLFLIKTDSPDPVGLGGTLTYDLSVFNEGPDQATDIVVTDTLPPEVTLVSATPSPGGTCTTTGPVTCTFATLDTFGVASVQIVVTAPSSEATLTNTASVSSTLDDPDTTDNSRTETTEVRATADLMLTKSDAPDPATVGEQLTYTLTVTNDGPQAATNVTLRDDLPPATTFGTATPTKGSCTEDAGVVTCTIGTLTNGEQATVTITVMPDSGGVLSNSASVSSDEADPNLGDNGAFAETTVKWPHDLAITKSDSPDPIYVGDEVTYAVTVENTGALAATNVTVTDTLPAGLVFVSGAGCTAAGPVVTCGLGSLASGATASVDIVAEATASGKKTNTATATADEGDQNPDNDSATEETIVRDTALDIARASTREPSLISGASWVAIPPNGNPNAVSKGPLTPFPIHGETFGILTTGDADLAYTPNDSGSSGANVSGPNVRGNTDFDVSILKIDVVAPGNTNCLSFNFRFLSEEFPEYVGTQFNDAFVAELDTSDWTTSGSTISAPHNFAFDPQGDVISINATGATSMSAADAAGTTYDGGTPILSASTPIMPGAHSLYLSIFDQGDHVLDSAVFLDDLVIGQVAEGSCVPGATPLVVRKTADSATTPAGGANGYTITVTNSSADPLTLTEISDTLPAGFTYTAGSTAGATTADPTVAGQLLTWSGPFTVPGSGSLSLHFGVTVALEPGDYFNEAAAKSDSVPVEPTGPTATVTVTVTQESTLSIDDVTVTEGDSGEVDATFTVSLSVASAQEVTVDFATADDTANAPGDYTATSGTLTFAPGETAEQVAVKVQGDTLDEGDEETFFVNLSNPSNAGIGDGEGLGTIRDDDPEPTLSIDDVSVTEGDSGQTEAAFTVSLLPASGKQVTVDYVTVDGTATAPGDYTAIATTTLTFAPGETEKQVAVAVQGDTLDEADEETFFVNLSNPVNATIADDQGKGTIVDDDEPIAPALDDFKCYEADRLGTKFDPRQVVLTDQFNTERVNVVRTEIFCNPAAENGGEINDPNAHLTCYQIRDVRGDEFLAFTRRRVEANDQFGTHTLLLRKIRTLCVPSSKSPAGQIPGPPPTNLDHFKCYTTKQLGTRFDSRRVLLTDQFHTERVNVMRPEAFCTPVDKNDEGILDQTTHLTCYKIRDVRGDEFPRFREQRVEANDQFGAQTLRLEKTRTLCVPSSKTVL